MMRALSAPPDARTLLPMSRFTQARLATMAILFCNGAIYASWGVHLPTIKDRFGLSDAVLSLAMLAVAAGGILVMAWGGRWVGRAGSAHAAVRSGLLMAGAAFGILLIPSYALLLPWLLAYGAASAVNDIAANSQGVMLETHFGKPIIGALHGSFSVGGICGALAASAWRAAGWPDALHMLAVCSLCALLTLAAAPGLVQERDLSPGTGEAATTAAASVKDDAALYRRLRMLGLLAFLGLVVEGAMYDWTAVYMRDVAHAAPGLIGAGYAAFSIGMAAGRFLGDPVRARFGARSVILCSCGLCIAGVGAALAIPSPLPAAAGFLLAGLGLSNVIPIMFSSAGREAIALGRGASAGLAVTTRLAYVGLLAGPVIVGAIAHALTLRTALALLLLCALAIALVSMRFFRPAHDTGI
jgi:MFS family permease